MEKRVEIKCVGAALAMIDKLKPFQGKLKSLSKDNYNKLKKQILELGFSEPISVWQESKEKNDGYFILNGHQRLFTLTQMRTEGYDIPLIPISLVSADSFTEAKKKVLSLTSQYGQIEEEGLYEFLAEANIDFQWASDSLRMPEIDMDKFWQNFGDTELDDGPEKEKNKKYSIEVEFPDEMEMALVYEELLGRGYIVRISNG